MMITKNKENLSRVKSSLVDDGYTGDPFAEAVKELLGATVEVVKRSELHKFAVIPKRWVVERSFAWLDVKLTRSGGGSRLFLKNEDYQKSIKAVREIYQNHVDKSNLKDGDREKANEAVKALFGYSKNHYWIHRADLY